MLEVGEILSGLLVLGAMGVTVVAYQHPEGYGRLHAVLAGILGLLLIALGSRDFGRMDAHMELRQYIKDSAHSAAYETIENGQFLFGPLFWTIIGTFVYLGFLSFLPNILGKAPKEPSGKDNP